MAASTAGISGAPSTVLTNTPFTVVRIYTVSGTGSTPAFSISYFASLSGVFGASDNVLIGKEQAPAGPVGSYSGNSPPLSIPNSGTYWLLAWLDSDNQVIETDKSNNVTVSPVQIVVTAPVIPVLTVVTGSTTINGSSAKCVTPPSLCTTDFASPEQHVSCNPTLAGGFYLICRYVDPSNFWFAYVNGAKTSITIYERLNGVNTPPPGASGPIVYADGQLLEVIATGTTIIARYNGVEICRWASASDFSTATKAGFQFNMAGESLTGFAVAAP